jgi:oligopeptidase B
MKNFFLTIFAVIAISACQTDNKTNIMEPVAKKIPTQLNYHSDSITDNYFWMRLSDQQKEATSPDAQTQDVLNYLNDENSYLDSQMLDTDELQKKLFDEYVSRIKQDDASIPYSDNGYTYYAKFEQGQDYRRYYRKKNEAESSDELILDLPKLAQNQSYFSLGDWSVSSNNKILAYSTDLISRREYNIQFKDLSTGELLEDKIEATAGGITWANDNKTVFYVKKDPQTLRSNKIYKHVLGTDSKNDELVFEEKDETYSCYVYKSKSNDYLFIGSYQTLSTEVRFLDANKPNGTWTIIQPRERGLEYSVSHYDDAFFIRTNWDAKNFKLMKTSVSSPSKENWKDLIEHREDVFLSGLEIFKNYLVLKERKDGLTQMRVINWLSDEEHYITFNDPTYSLYANINLDFDTDLFRFSYSSLTTPNSTYDYNLATKERTLLKQQEVLGGKFNSENYISERQYALSRDGITKIPISIVYNKKFKKDGTAPVLLYGYGSYGANMDPYFSLTRLSLLDRGFAFAIAHIRGGQEMGRDWYEDGKLLKKKNTFNDFIDCGHFLVENNYTSPSHMYAQGGSAGGLLMGAIINQEPKLWNGVIAGVPFVDVINTMWDESIPLTTSEFDEWGNPKDKVYYDYIKSYSPYDNIQKMDYPNLLVTTGYWDSQVQYWEPAKWIAKLRDYRTNQNMLVMSCNMDVGHGGASGRFESLREVALEHAFLLKLEGITE